MLLDKTVKIKWNSKNKNRYVELGYHFTKMGDTFDIDIEHLSDGSAVLVSVKCDYCFSEYQTKWYNYKRSHKYVEKDCCNNPKCTGAKSNDVIREKYNIDSVWHLDFVKEKTKNTNIERYGSENPFGNADIREKIKNYNLTNYGVEYSMQRPETVEKSKATCIEKYGVTNYGKIYSESHARELSPTWKGGVEHHRSERSTLEYRTWRKDVFERDSYTCQCCYAKNGNGKYIRLEAHHINDWKNNPNDRYNIENGATLCSKCHMQFHSIFGKHGNNFQQYLEFIKNNISDKKIC